MTSPHSSEWRRIFDPRPAARRVTVMDSLDLLGPAIETLTETGVEVIVVPAGQTPEATIALAATSPVAIVGALRLGLDELSSLASGETDLLIRPGIGYDNIDVEAAASVGITVANIPDYCVDEVADHTMLLLLAAQRRLLELAALSRASWQVNKRLPRVSRVKGSTLGVIGLGRIGSAVATRAASFGWDVIAHDPYVSDARFNQAEARSVELDHLFRSSDAITLHCPLTDTTRRIVDAQRLLSILPGCVLVNTSRGDLVDLDAVELAVRDGRLGAVGFDVLAGEPDPPLDHPLLAHPQVTITPHVAWYSVAAQHELAVKSAQEALRWLDTGAVRNPVNEISAPAT